MKKILIIILAILAFYLALKQYRQNIAEIPYLRTDYQHWIDEDHDCQNTRQEVLISESIEPVELDQKGCKVIAGKWHDPYTDQYFNDPSELDIDHFVPLKHAHLSGASQWSKAKKISFANDLKNPNTLIAVAKSANRSKSDKSVSQWLPPNQKYHCQYIKNWLEVKQYWQLAINDSEANFLKKKLKQCDE
jgi:hypothetical protein